MKKKAPARRGHAGKRTSREQPPQTEYERAMAQLAQIVAGRGAGLPTAKPPLPLAAPLPVMRPLKWIPEAGTAAALAASIMRHRNLSRLWNAANDRYLVAHARGNDSEAGQAVADRDGLAERLNVAAGEVERAKEAIAQQRRNVVVFGPNLAMQQRASRVVAEVFGDAPKEVPWGVAPNGSSRMTRAEWKEKARRERAEERVRRNEARHPRIRINSRIGDIENG